MSKKPAKLHENNIFSYVILILWTCVIVFIFGWVIVSSFKTNLEIYQKPWALPAKATFENYVSAWSTMHMKDYFVNSLIVVFSALAICILISTMASHALTRYEYRGRETLLNLLIATMSVPLQMYIIPLYTSLQNLGLINTRFGLIIVYGSLWFPFSLFVLSGFFKTVPKELEESALIDGCNEYQIFFHVMVPMVQPGIICISVFNFVAMWNEYLLALVFTNKQKLRTIALGMYALKDSMMYTSNWGGLFAAIVIMMIPSMLIFVTLRKYVIQGLTLGAIKG